MASINPQNVSVLSALDKLISEHKNNPTLVCGLFQKKQMLLHMIKARKIDANEYKSFVGNAYKEESGTIKACAEQDFQKLKDPKDEKLMGLWFKEMIASTMAPYQNQKKVYQMYRKQLPQSNKSSEQTQLTTVQEPKVVHKQSPPPIQKPKQVSKPLSPIQKQKKVSNPSASKMEKPIEVHQASVQSDSNVDEIVSFKSLDSKLEEYSGPIDKYEKLFERKKKLLGLVDRKQMTADKYKQTLELYCKRLTGTQIAYEYNLELEGIDDFHDGNIATWFKEIIEETKDSLQQQTQKLEKLKKARAEPQKRLNPKMSIRQSAKVGNKQKKMAFDIKQLNSFSAFDEQMFDQSEDKNNYKAILEKKKKFLQLGKKGALNGQKYKALLLKFVAQGKNEEIKQSMKYQLDQLNQTHQNNIETWWKDTVQNANQMLEDQQNVLADLENIIVVKPQTTESDDVIDMKLLNDQDDDSIHFSDEQDVKLSKHNPKKQVTKSQPKDEVSIIKPSIISDASKIVSLKVLDQLLTQNEKNSQKFCLYFQQKQAIFDKMKKGEIDAQKYKALQEKSLSLTTDENIKQSIEMDLADVNDIYQGNVDNWFENLIEEAGLMFEDQEEKYQKYKVKSKPKASVPSTKVHQQAQPQTKPSSKLGEASKIVSLKVLDQLLTQNEKNSQKFCLYFQQKQAIFDKMKKGEIDAQKYKALQEKSLSLTTDENIKQSIEMDLADVNDIYQGNVDNWFENLIEEAGLMFEDQEEKYQKYKVKSKPKASVPSTKIHQQTQPFTQKSFEITQNPNILELVSITALTKLFDHCVKTSDILYYKELSEKREKLVDLISQGKLFPTKYKEINAATAKKTSNTFLKECITQEIQMLTSKFNGNEQEWFLTLKTNLHQQPPQLKLPENPEIRRVNQLPAQDKVEYLARRMAAYESLIGYFKTHKIDLEHPLFQNYERSQKKQAFKAIKMLQKDPEMDIYNLAEKLFPRITAEMFYNNNLPALKKKIGSTVDHLIYECAALKDYAGKRKKETNVNNIQNAKKQIAKCQQDIAQLKQWPGKQLVPFPVITQAKVEKYNLDLQTHLDQNQIQIKITQIVGMKNQSILKIYVGAAKGERFWVKVRNGPQASAKTIVKLPTKELMELMKGQPGIVVRLFEKGFFGGMTLVGQCPLVGSLIRNNIVEEKATSGLHTFNYELRVYKPTSPLVTEITHTTVTILPAFKPIPSVEYSLVKECLDQFNQ